jgi:hypothetical protein
VNSRIDAEKTIGQDALGLEKMGCVQELLRGMGAPLVE